MPGAVDAARNVAIDAVAAVARWISVHTADGGAAGANEVSGGSPAYARKQATYAAAASGAAANTGLLTIDMPAGSTAAFLGQNSAVTAGTWYGCAPNGGFLPLPATVATTDTFTCPAHGYANGDRVCVLDANGAGVATGLTEGTLYYVVSSATDTFQLSATLGGAAVDVTASGKLFVWKGIVESFVAQGQLSIPISSLSLVGNII